VAASDEAEVSNRERDLADLAEGCNSCEGADSSWKGELVVGADEHQGGAVEVGEVELACVDPEAAVDQAIGADDVADKVLEGGTGPCNETFAAEEASAEFALRELITVVQRAQEIDPLSDFFVWMKELETKASE